MKKDIKRLINKTPIDIYLLEILPSDWEKMYDKIIEFGAVKIKDGLIVESKQMFIDPQEEISEFTTKLTGGYFPDLKRVQLRVFMRCTVLGND